MLNRETISGSKSGKYLIETDYQNVSRIKYQINYLIIIIIVIKKLNS